MGFREADVVVAAHALSNPVTGNAVASGNRGVIVKQIGSQPATYRVRFDSSDDAQQSLIIDDVTDHDIAPASAVITTAERGAQRDVYRWKDSSRKDKD